MSISVDLLAYDFVVNLMNKLPPTSVTIQNGSARAIIANISAVRNKAPDISVNFSIFTNQNTVQCQLSSAFF